MLAGLTAALIRGARLSDHRGAPWDRDGASCQLRLGETGEATHCVIPTA